MRICPVCDTKTEETTCPNDGYETIDLTRFREEGVADPLIGKVLRGRYKVVKKLGEGGMGAVYLGLHTTLKQEVAIKVLTSELSSDVNAVKRFHREALSASKLSHPNTVRIFDFGEDDDGLLYLVMELVRGLPLSKMLYTEMRLAPDRVVPIIRQVLGALAEAHKAGIVHRDLKPANIMITNQPGAGEFVKVVDFGIAKIVHGSEDTAITRAGGVVGTPTYMSPEQAEGLAIDQRTDLYALGVIMYEMMTGSPPFMGDTPISIMVSHKMDPVPPMPTEVAYAVPLELAQMVTALLEKTPDRRPQNAEAALAMLPAAVPTTQFPREQPSIGGGQAGEKTARRPDPEPAPPPGSGKGIVWVFVLLAVVAAGIGGGLYLYFEDPFGFFASPVIVAPPVTPDTVEQIADDRREVVITPQGPSKVVRLRSEPAGATVVENGREVGVTPYMAVMSGRTRVLTIRKPGYMDKVVPVSGMEPEIEVRLTAGRR